MIVAKSEIHWGMADSRKLKHDVRQLMKLYDEKRYKKALKVAEEILSQHPDHVETIALKALCILCAPSISSENALDVAKLAVRTNPKQCAAWHALGLVQKDRKDYLTAFRTLKMAWRLANGSLNVLRDLLQLGVQSQSYSEMVDLAKIPSLPTWAAATLISAFWLDGRVELALDLINDLENRIEMHRVSDRHS